MAELAPEVRELIAKTDEMMAQAMAAGPLSGGTMDQMRTSADGDGSMARSLTWQRTGRSRRSPTMQRTSSLR